MRTVQWSAPKLKPLYRCRDFISMQKKQIITMERLKLKSASSRKNMGLKKRPQFTQFVHLTIKYRYSNMPQNYSIH